MVKVEGGIHTSRVKFEGGMHESGRLCMNDFFNNIFGLKTAELRHKVALHL